MEQDKPSAMPDTFDRLLGSLNGLPDVTNTKPSTIMTITTLLGTSETYIVQTFRQLDRAERIDLNKPARSKDTIFIQRVTKDGSIRIALPAPVADLIARQRDALTGKMRSKIGKANAAARKAAGIQPGFMKGRKKTK